jgi:hypothetical protein
MLILFVCLSVGLGAITVTIIKRKINGKSILPEDEDIF